MLQSLRRVLVPLAYFSNNLISRIGIFLVTAATVLWIFAIPTMVLGKSSNPYAGILLFVVLPGCFFLGLILIPLGVVRHRRAAQHAGWVLPEKIDFTNSKVRNVFAFTAAATVLNLAIGTQFTYTAVNYMEGVSFCGTSCHVMRPEFAAFSKSVHRNVECVRCHAGPGAAGFVESKMAGVHQLVDTLLQRYDKPVHPRIPPLSGRETCELCHSRDTDYGDKVRTTATFASDESNTRSDSVMLMHVGGGKRGKGIHGAHLGAGVEIEFAVNPNDTKAIQAVRVRHVNGATDLYVSPDARASSTDTAQYRAMDCADCHNRVAHAATSPDRAMDEALARGDIDARIPFIRRQGTQILQQAKVETAIGPALREFYASQKTVAEPALANAISSIRQIWRDNVFPELSTSWGTHPDQLGHTAAPGCFRCHDGDHVASKGRVLTQDCEVCHHVVALEEQKPKILDDLGVSAVH